MHLPLVTCGKRYDRAIKSPIITFLSIVPGAIPERFFLRQAFSLFLSQKYHFIGLIRRSRTIKPDKGILILKVVKPVS